MGIDINININRKGEGGREIKSISSKKVLTERKYMNYSKSDMKQMVVDGQDDLAVKYLIGVTNNNRRYDKLHNQLITLSSRISQFKSDKLSILSPGEISRESSKIAQAILSYINQYYGNSEESSIPQAPSKENMNKEYYFDYSQKLIIEICEKVRRTNEELYNEGMALYQECSQYHFRRLTNGLFDLENIDRETLYKKIDTFTQKSDEANAKNQSNFIDSISSLISARVPEWDDLDVAYTILETRGIYNEYIKTQLDNRSNDINAKVRVASEIERILKTLS